MTTPSGRARRPTTPSGRARRPTLRFTTGSGVGLAVAVLAPVMVGACVIAERQEWPDTYAGAGDDAFLVDDDFACLADERWAVVEGRRIWNVFGGMRQEQAVERAARRTPGEFPVGTVVQLFPGEAMVKRGQGFAPSTNDWEYLVLDTSTGQTVITARGTDDVGNVGGSCVSCHGAATAFDSVCFTNSSCRPLPAFVDTDVDPATADPRCR